MLSKMVISILATLIQSIAVSIILFKLVDNCNKMDKIKFIIGIWLYSIVCYWYIPNQFRFILFILIISLLLHFIFKVNDKKIILYAFSAEFLLFFSEILVTVLLVLLGFNSKMIVNDIKLNLIVNILISFLIVVLSTMPFIKKTYKLILDLFNKNGKMANYLLMFLVMFYLILSKNGHELILEPNYFISIIFMIGIIYIVYIIIKGESKLEQLQDANNQMLHHVTKYEKVITQQGKSNHEFKNQLMVIKGYAQMDKPEKLIDYIDSVIDDSKHTYSSFLISQLNKFPDGGIKGLLYYKLSIMEDEKIKYMIDVEDGVKEKLKNLSTIMHKDVTKVLGVILDNAIDASKKAKEKKIIISVTKGRGKVIFSISNTYKGHVDIDKIGTGYSTKGSGHGYGLRLVNDILSNNENINITKNLEDEYFVTEIKIKVSKQNKKTVIK